jgi:MFS superfamily sulfate permease-like transporter
MNQTTPGDYLIGLKENWKKDILSGFSIFLIAMPLCIGIAIASGAPPLAGILAGIVGGILASLLSGSFVTINGPAAGLIVIVLGSIEVLGHGDKIQGFKYTLAAIFIAGLIQILMGILGLGIIASVFPSAVIHGMLASIGVIIISKQIHGALGVSPGAKSVFGLIKEIPESITNLNPKIALIGILSILILAIYPLIKSKITKIVPGPLVLVVVGSILAVFFGLSQEHYYDFLGKQFFISSKFMVSIPDKIIDTSIHPDFSIMYSPVFLLQVFSISMVASVESLLTASAIDKLDPYKRRSNMNRELIGKGIGNTILGMIGGIPIIAEVVRSSANINNGAQTRWSNFFHGLFLLLAVIFLQPIIQMIPLAALSGMLVVVGYRLAAPEIKKIFKSGFDQFVIFFSTIMFTLLDDLLVGVAVGVIINFILHIINTILPDGVTLNDFFRPDYRKEEIETNGKVVEIKYHFKGLLIFINYLFLKIELEKQSKDVNISLDLKDLRLIDNTVNENLHEYEKLFKEQGRIFRFEGLENSRSLSSEESSGRKIER